jgi:hypothetical protein
MSNTRACAAPKIENTDLILLAIFLAGFRPTLLPLTPAPAGGEFPAGVTLRDDNRVAGDPLAEFGAEIEGDAEDVARFVAFEGRRGLSKVFGIPGEALEETAAERKLRSVAVTERSSVSRGVFISFSSGATGTLLIHG